MVKDNYVIHKIFIGSLGVFMAVEITHALSNVVDGMITGHYLGSAELAACGIAKPFFSIVGIISGILAAGTQVVCSKSMGEGNMEETNHLFSLTCMISLLISLVVMVTGILFAGPIGMAFGATGKTAYLLPYTREYLRGVFLGTPTLIGFAVLSPIMQLDGDGRRVKVAIFVLAVLNIAGDLLNVTVFHGGMFGMGLTTSIAEGVAFGILLLHFRKRDALFRFHFCRIHFKEMAQVLKIGLPRATKRLCKVFCPIIVNHRILYIGAGIAMSAYSVEQSIEDLAMIAASGIAEAVFLISGIFYGEQDRKAMSGLFHEAFKFSLILSGGIGLGIFIGAPWIVRVYVTDSKEIIKLATIALRILALSLPLASINQSLISYMQTIRKMKLSILFVVLQRFVIPIANCYLLSMIFGTVGIYLVFVFNELFLFLALMVTVWRQNKKFPRCIDDCMMLPEEFGVPKENAIEISVQNMDQVIGLSVQVENFCKVHGIDARRRYFLSLCVEEMAGNVVKHGFSDGKKHGLDIRVLIIDNTLVLRMRDDCRPFDLKKWGADMPLNDPCRGIGIRLVLGIADQVSYVNSLKTNNLLIAISQKNGHVRFSKL